MKFKSYPWLIVAMLCVVGALNYLDRMMITTMRSSLVEAIPMTDAQFGLLTAVFLWIYGILSPFAGFLADRFSRSRVIIGSLFVWSAVTWLTSYATSFESLLVTRALMGISESCYAPAAVALIMDYHRGSTRSLANGIHMAGIMVGQSMGFVGGWLATDHSWNYPFFIFGMIGIGYAVILLFSLKDAPKQPSTIAQGLHQPEKVKFRAAVKDLLGRRGFIFALTCWSLLGIIGWMIVGWLPTYFKENFNLSQTMAGVYSTGYFHAASLIGVITGGILADRWARKNPRGRILVPVVGLCLAAPAIFLASHTTILSVAIGCFMLYSFTRIFTDGNMMPILCLITDERYRATAYGILNFFSCIIGGIGLYAGGALRDAKVDLSTVFQTGAVLLALCAFLLYKIQPTPESITVQQNDQKESAL
ncbi:MFS transporter [Larkinella arboricola]|nr:MFS transporter [Larkinella arboricola]